MDRFDVPGQSSLVDISDITGDDEDNEHIALVWDRGPAGDFVYGNLNDLPLSEKKKRYEEFMAFDRQVCYLTSFYFYCSDLLLLIIVCSFC